LGFLCAIADVVLMWLGNSIYPEHYDWIHGTHHIACFGAISCIIKPIVVRKREFIGIELTPRLGHRRSLSMNALKYL